MQRMELKVLIIDDDPIVVFLHKKIVQKCELSAEPLSFLNGKQCLGFFQGEAKETENHLLLLDINMPVMDGWEFLEAIRQTTFGDKILVVLTTSSVDSNDRKRAGDYAQIFEFLEKPLTMEKCFSLKDRLKEQKLI